MSDDEYRVIYAPLPPLKGFKRVREIISGWLIDLAVWVMPHE